MAVTTTVEQLKPAIIFQKRRKIPAVWMRSGTSKGLFIHEKDLPASVKLWEDIFLSAMGSAQASAKQLNGIGGATSTSSKVAVISKSTRPNIDVDYTFIQVAPDQPKIDMTGNCGNIAAGVGPFSLDEGIVKAQPGQPEIDIRIFNTNTKQTIVETVHVAPDGRFREDGDYELPGVKGTASPIKVAFLKPQGSMTGKMFPSGAKKEIITVHCRSGDVLSVRVSLVDAANPFVLVDASSISLKKNGAWPVEDDTHFLSTVEDIRREGAVRFGLAEDTETAGLVRGTPKIAFLSRVTKGEDGADIEVLSFTMGKPHTSLQLTGAVCIGTAMAIYGSIASDLAAERIQKHGMTVADQNIASPLPVGIRHPSGTIHTETTLEMNQEGEFSVEKVAVFRTARRLFEGNVFY
ncbi:hypothetical protein N7462_004705 [Penicillium macrosclerotiorum]|uniref:uncharacterized protein n=1 Tax=Penicillium macrosclerotiorum TaxID=303699 RepID=UPI0025470455|nr:uncharacterized protein N7462_004705 [Penicillium macrosclerotiorum]KAJ5690313.1 hypothetical protein N7462_004705 [Penicillium macrosclerotiorum]